MDTNLISIGQNVLAFSLSYLRMVERTTEVTIRQKKFMNCKCEDFHNYNNSLLIFLGSTQS